MAAHSRRPISVYGCVLDNPRLLLKLSLGAGYSRLWAAKVSTSGLGGLGEILRGDTSGSSAPCDRETGGGVSLSIISGGRSPEDELCGEGLRAGLQQICFGYYPQRQNGIYLPKYSFTYDTVEGWPPCGRCAVRIPPGAGPFGEGFFPRLEASVSKSS